MHKHVSSVLMFEIILTALFKNCTVFYELIMCFACKSHMYVK